jgi:hypothetical protein
VSAARTRLAWVLVPATLAVNFSDEGYHNLGVGGVRMDGEPLLEALTGEIDPWLGQRPALPPDP